MSSERKSIRIKKNCHRSLAFQASELYIEDDDEEKKKERFNYFLTLSLEDLQAILKTTDEYDQELEQEEFEDPDLFAKEEDSSEEEENGPIHPRLLTRFFGSAIPKVMPSSSSSSNSSTLHDDDTQLVPKTIPALEAVRARLAAEDPEEEAIQRPYLLNQLVNLSERQYNYFSLSSTPFFALYSLYNAHTGNEFVPTAPSWPAELEEEVNTEGGKEVTEGTTIDTDEAVDPDLDATNSGSGVVNDKVNPNLDSTKSGGIINLTKSGGTETTTNTGSAPSTIKPGAKKVGKKQPLPVPLTAAEALAKKTAAEALAKKNAAIASRNAAIAKQTAAQLAAEEDEAQRKAEEEAEDAEQDDDDDDYDDDQQDDDDDDGDFDDEELAPAAKKKRTNPGTKAPASKSGVSTSTPKSSRKRATTEQSFDIETTQLLRGLQEQLAAIDLLATQHIIRPIKAIKGLAEEVNRGAQCVLCTINNVARPARPSSVCVGCSCVINHTPFLVCSEHATKHAFDKAK